MRRARKTAPVQTPAGDMSNLEMFARLDADQFLQHQLFRRGVSAAVFEGSTTSATRLERIRRLILEHDLDRAPVLDQRQQPQAECLAEAFERLYQQPLIQ